MNRQKNIAAFLVAATAAMIAMTPVNAQQKTIDGDDDEWFMEETTPKDKQPKKPVNIPDGAATNLGVPMTEDGRIIPTLKNDNPSVMNDNSMVMPQQSQLQVTNEYIIQPGAYYPGMPQMNVPYGGINPYYAPGVMPYRPGINIGLGKAGNINIGGGGYYNNPYGYGYPGYGTGYGTYPYGYGTGYAPGYMGNIGGIGGIGGLGGINRMNGIGFPGMAVPNIVTPGFGIPGAIPGVNVPAGFR